MHRIIEIPPSSNTMTWGFMASNIAPVVTIDSGTVVRMTTFPAGSQAQLHNDRGRVKKEHLDALRKLRKGAGSHLISGPVYITGAAPGDVLQVDILSVELTHDWGRVSTVPLLGALPEEFAEPTDIFADIDLPANECMLPWGVRVPLSPFFGLIATAPPPQWGECSSTVPRSFGGNLDNKELKVGTTLYLPVFNDGALFFVGDAHGVQGDGEVCVTGLETGAVGDFRLTVRKDLRLDGPFAESGTHLISMGLHDELAEAARAAVRQMIGQVCLRSSMTRTQAYMLCSLAGDLHVTQLVDGNKGVHMMIRKSLLEGPEAPGQSSHDGKTINLLQGDQGA